VVTSCILPSLIAIILLNRIALGRCLNLFSVPDVKNEGALIYVTIMVVLYSFLMRSRTSFSVFRSNVLVDLLRSKTFIGRSNT
jgi:hypothetical protein